MSKLIGTVIAYLLIAGTVLFLAALVVRLAYSVVP